MLETALLQDSMDTGLLAETLLFYQNVHLVFRYGTAGPIINAVGYDNFVRLIDEGHLNVSILKEHFAVATAAPNGIPYHEVAPYILVSDKKKGKSMGVEEMLFDSLERSGVTPTLAKKQAKQLASKIPATKTEIRPMPSISLREMAREDFRDSTYVSRAANLLASKIANGAVIPPNWRFNLIDTGEGFFADTNYDFAELTRMSGQMDDPVSVATILSAIVLARVKMHLAAKNLSELVCDPVEAELIRLKVGTWSSKRSVSLDDIGRFEEVALSGKSVRGAINSGERTFGEFMELLDRSRRFKAWLKASHPERGLLVEYTNAISADSWLDRLPIKLSRFFFTNGVGVGLDVLGAGGLASLGFSAADTFLVERVLKGWRPNHFVQQQLMPFVGEP